MGYVGVPPQSGFITTAKQRVTSSTNNYVDLDHAISNLSDVIVWVNFVKQDSTNLTLTSSSRITLGANLQNSDIVEISFLGKAVATQTPSSGTVTNDMLAGSIANSKLANSSITLNGSAVSLGGSATVGETNTPAWFVRYGGEQSLSDYTTTKVTWNVEELDTNSAFASDKFTVPSGGAGKYIIFTSLLMKGDGNDRLVKTDLHIYKNGSSIAFAHDDFRSDNSRQATRMIQTIQTLAENDYIEVYTAVDISSGTPYYEGANFRGLFGGYRIIT